MTGPVRLGAVLAAPAAMWVLVGSAGLWCADCLLPGCGWTTTTGTNDAASTAATLHVLNHPAAPAPAHAAQRRTA